MSFADAGAEKSKVEMCAFEIFKLVFLSFPLFNFLADARAEKKKIYFAFKLSLPACDIQAAKLTPLLLQMMVRIHNSMHKRGSS